MADQRNGGAMKALNIKQPWASLIVNGFKDVENRDWKPRSLGLKFRGRVLIHAGKQIDDEALAYVLAGVHPVTHKWVAFDVQQEFVTGGIVGEAEIVDVVTDSTSPWFTGPYGLVLRNAHPLLFRPCKGQLGFFNAAYHDEG